jgi:hypothetical protein
MNIHITHIVSKGTAHCLSVLHLAVLVLGNIYSDFFPLAGFSSRRPMYVVKKLKYIQKKTAFQRINY